MPSTVLKAGSSDRVLKRLATVDLADHLREAHGVIEEARRRAADHLARSEAQSKQDADAARQAAYSEGFRKGAEEGAQSGLRQALAEATERFNREHGHLVADLQRVVAEFDARKEELGLAAQRDLLDFAVLLAQKMTYAIGSQHRDAVVENVRRAIECVSRATDLTIRVNSADTAALETFASTALRQVQGSAAVRIQVDDSIAPGGCVVQSDRTEVDARLETQAEEIAALLLGTSVSRGLQPARTSAQAKACGSHDDETAAAPPTRGGATEGADRG